MILKWKAIDNRGRVLGRGRFSSYGRAFVAAQRRYGDRFSAVLVDGPRVKPIRSVHHSAFYSDRENFPSWDAGR